MRKKKTWLDKGIDNLSKIGALEGKTILKDALPQKMSEALLDFAMPLLDTIDITNKRALDSTLRIAVVVWNYSIVKDKPTYNSKDAEANRLLNLMVTQISGDPNGREIVSILLARKKQLYPTLAYMIADFDLNWDDLSGEFHLTVLATDRPGSTAV
jgi:hypothetical protein